MSTPARSTRDLGIDFLRGYFLFVIIINHVNSFPSAFELVTGRGQLWASTAEGFVLASGFLVGRLRGPMVARGDLRGVARILLKRAATLAGWSIGLTLFFTLVAHASGYAPNLGRGVDTGPPLWMLLKALTLQYTYGLHDMLPMYAWCLVASPLVLWAFARGWWWAVALVSVGLWGVGHWTAEPLLPSGSFSTASWQLLFFGGAFLGYRADQLRARWERVPPTWRTAVLVVATICTAVTMVASYSRLPPATPHTEAAPTPIVATPTDAGTAAPTAGATAPVPQRKYPFLFSKFRLGPGRIAIALLWLFTLYGLVKRYEPKVIKALGWLLIPIGQRSLYVYIVHALFLFAITGRPTHDLLLATATGGVAVAAIWLMVRGQVLYRVIPN